MAREPGLRERVAQPPLRVAADGGGDQAPQLTAVDVRAFGHHHGVPHLRRLDPLEPDKRAQAALDGLPYGREPNEVQAGDHTAAMRADLPDAEVALTRAGARRSRAASAPADSPRQRRKRRAPSCGRDRLAQHLKNTLKRPPIPVRHRGKPEPGRPQIGARTCGQRARDARQADTPRACQRGLAMPLIREFFQTGGASGDAGHVALHSA